MTPDRIVVFDTTLRDGEQSPGIALNVPEKLEIAEQLVKLGVDVIEAGFPVASQGDFEAVAAIARQVRGATVCALSRTHVADVDRAWEAVRDAARPRIHVFIATSPIHMRDKLRMTPEQVKVSAAEGVARAAGYTADVEFSPEDGTRSDPEFMCEVLQVAVDNGARTLNIPDTVGYATSGDFGELIRHVVETVRGPDGLVISTHCHNDLGMAVANSLAGVVNGARQVECTVNGLGERAGNAALEEIVMAVRTRPDVYGVETGIDTAELSRTSKMVARLTGYHVQYNKAVVGRNAFAHESGIHQHGVLSNKATYEIMDAEAVGQSTEIVLGKHSGRHAFSDALERLGFSLGGDAVTQAFQRFKELADRKVQITEADLEAIVAEEIGGDTGAWRLVAFSVSGGSTEVPTATVRLQRDTMVREETAEGDGMIDAACRAIEKAVELPTTLLDFTAASVTGETDALADVTIRVGMDDMEVGGRGVSTDVVEASARAYLNAVNRVLRLRDRPGYRRHEDDGP